MPPRCDQRAVHDEERALILEARGEPGADPATARFLGLAFSGGGIRSATFNLGLLQGLAKLGLLKHVDYLSTVSGGGYIGGWYAAFLRRHAGGDPARAEATLNPERPRREGEPVEPAALTWLRRYSNYLTPRSGLSGDTLTAVATYLRNLLLNLSIVLAFLGMVLLAPRGLALAVPWARSGAWLPWLAGGALVVAMAVVMFLLFDPQPEERRGWRSSMHRYAAGWVLAPALLAAWSLALGLATWGEDNALFILVTQAIAMGGYLLPWVLGGIVIALLRRDLDWRDMRAHGLSALAASLLAGLLFNGLAELADATRPEPHELTVFGPPLVLLAFLLPVGLHVGLARRRFTDMQREWWARQGGWILAAAAAWLLLAFSALYGPTLMDWLGVWLTTGGGLLWLVSTGWGILAGKGSKTGGVQSRGVREALLGIVPWIFIVGLLGLLALGLQKGMQSTATPKPGGEAQTARWSGQASVSVTLPTPQAGELRLSGSGRLAPGDTGLTAWRDYTARTLAAVPAAAVGWTALGSLAIFLLLGWRIDINLFSIHNFYRNRLTRCYLGASRSCTPVERCLQPDECRNAFTGFDPSDDIAVADLCARPYPLINTALNLVGGDELAWQERRAASFTIAPLYSGYCLPGTLGGEVDASSFRLTRDFLSSQTPGGVRLGTAMAISGAAVNPNMGFHSSPAVSFLLTVFNVRLGRWCGNPGLPGEGSWRETSPSFGARYLFLELFGLTSARRDWLNLSDGGHFENLGLYELARRRVPYIIASDAAQDADYSFEDLANAVRKIRTDLGMDVEIDLSGLRPSGDAGRQRAYASIGRIRYDQVDPTAQPGLLVYLRPGLTGREPADILSYAQDHPPFPFQSTADQFFDESQFESYRRLGQWIAEKVFAEASARAMRGGGLNLEVLYGRLYDNWRGRLAVDVRVAQGHQERLDALFERLRGEKALAFLSWDLFPEWPFLLDQPVREPALPERENERVSGFYLCREAAALMERVYCDLDLEDNHDHPDCRGWMNLFRNWSWSPMFRATYAITASTLGEPFQRFCEQRLGLGVGEVELMLGEPTESYLDTLNFVERQLIDQRLPEPQRDLLGGRLGLARFDLVIRYPNAVDPAARTELLRFHFGFALLLDRRLAYLRVQDHLRRLGLARRALLALDAQVEGLALLAGEERRHPALTGLLGTVRDDEQEAFRILFRSVKEMRGA
jgi:hypothetical protein